MKGKAKNLTEIHIAVLLFGSAGLFGKFLSLPPSVIVFGRTFFASLSLLIIVRIFKYSLKINSRRDSFGLIFLGALLAVHWIAFFKSIQISTVAIGLLTFSTFPIFVTFIEPYFFKEKLKSSDIAMAFVVFLGVFLIIPKFDISNAITQGVLWGIFSGLTFALLSIINRKYVRKYSPLVIAFYQDTFSAIFLIPILFLSEYKIRVNDVLMLIFLGVFCTAVAHSLFIKGMVRVKAQTASIITCLEPIYGIIFAMILLSEIPGIRTALGGIVIIATVFYITLGKR